MTIVLIDEHGWTDETGARCGEADDVLGLVDALTYAEAAVLGRLPEPITSRPINFELLQAALRPVPLFIVVGPDQYLVDGRSVSTRFARSEYDRLFVREETADQGPAPQIVSETTTDRDALLALARKDLGTAAVPSFLDLSAILAITYAGQPAYDHVPALGSRKASKIVHVAQSRALEQALQPLLERLGLASRPTLLDFGCGSGRLRPICTPRTRYCGLDRDSQAIAAAQKAHPGARFVEPEELDAGTREFDILLSFNVLQHADADERRGIYVRWHQLLRRGGSLVLLENFLPREPAGSGALPETLSIEEVVLDLGGAFGGSINVETFQTVSYPVYDGLSPSALINLNVYS